MFTDLIDEVGTTGAVANGPAGRELYIRAAYTGLVDGESIAVNGVCLTVREHDDDGFTVGAVETTLGRTTIGDWMVGRQVNLGGGHGRRGPPRRPHRLGARGRRRHRPIGGAVGGCAARRACPSGGGHGAFGAARLRHVRWSSQTINALPPDGTLQLSLIDYTLRHTTLGDLEVGDAVNVEADLIGKRVQKLMQPYRATSTTLSSRA
jgi:riboflavin synthase